MASRITVDQTDQQEYYFVNSNVIKLIMHRHKGLIYKWFETIVCANRNCKLYRYRSLQNMPS